MTRLHKIHMCNINHLNLHILFIILLNFCFQILHFFTFRTILVKYCSNNIKLKKYSDFCILICPLRRQHPIWIVLHAFSKPTLTFQQFHTVFTHLLLHTVPTSKQWKQWPATRLPFFANTGKPAHKKMQRTKLFPHCSYV